MPIKTIKPRPGIRLGLPYGSKLMRLGIRLCTKFGRIPSIQVKREYTVQIVIEVGARMSRPCKKSWNNLRGIFRSFICRLFICLMSLAAYGPCSLPGSARSSPKLVNIGKRSTIYMRSTLRVKMEKVKKRTGNLRHKKSFRSFGFDNTLDVQSKGWIRGLLWR